MDLFNLKALGVLLFATVKFFFAPAFALSAGFNYWETFILVCLGGYIGSSVFFWLTEEISAYWVKIRKPKPSRINRTKRFIVRLKKRFGMWGLSLFVPIFLSIPIGSAIMAKFYPSELRKTYFTILVSITVWSFMLSLLALVNGN